MEALKYLDAFPKALDEFRVKTSSGAVVSIISIVVITIIFVSELRYYMKAGCKPFDNVLNRINFNF